MLQIKSFVERQSLVDNTHKVISPIGELSTKAKTYAKDIKQFVDSDLAPGLKGHVFDSRRGETPEHDIKAIAVEKMLQVANYIYDRSDYGGNTESSDNLKAGLESDFINVLEEVVVGDMIEHAGKWMPGEVSFRFFDGLEDIFIRIWFSDTVFRQLYDSYEITVIPPIENIDLLLTSNINVKQIAASLRTVDLFERVDDITTDYPYTKLIALDFHVEDPNWDEADYVKFTWVVALYGLAGDNVDNIYKALTDYVLANSAQGEGDWVGRMPEMFRRIEFMIVPMWNNYSIPNQTLEAGIYSPILPYKKMLPTALANMPGYVDSHVENWLITTTFLHKSIALLICSGEYNRDQLWDLRTRYPDFAVISSTHYDFGRLSESTRDLLLLWGTMLSMAESMTASNPLPVGFSRIVRDGKVYLVASKDEIQYYMLAKMSYNEV